MHKGLVYLTANSRPGCKSHSWPSRKHLLLFFTSLLSSSPRLIVHSIYLCRTEDVKKSVRPSMQVLSRGCVCRSWLWLYCSAVVAPLLKGFGNVSYVLCLYKWVVNKLRDCGSVAQGLCLFSICTHGLWQCCTGFVSLQYIYSWVVAVVLRGHVYRA